MTYEQWMDAVNAEVLRITEGAIGGFDLADWRSRDCYDNEASATEGAIEALEFDDLGAAWLSEMGDAVG